MFKRISIYVILLWCSGIAVPTFAQQVIECTVVDDQYVDGEIFFNYGSVIDAYSFQSRSSYSVGETSVGVGISQTFNSYSGFWSRLLIPPLPATVVATQGELLDRIQLSWQINVLGSFPTQGFNIYRDGFFLAYVGQNVQSDGRFFNPS